MSDEAGKSTGLLSKVMGLVRGKEDAAPLSDSVLAPDSRQELREVVERKRRNLAVRQQEFAQLRQLRQQPGPSSPASAMAAPVASVLPAPADSTQHSTQTLRKIDVIEAQMSRQWWGGDKVHPAAGAAPVPEQIPTLGEDAVVPESAPPSLPPSAAAPVLQEFVPHPDLEEPAILFAHGDAQAARTRVLEHLAQVLSAQPVDMALAAVLWHAALDLCRAMGDEETFEPLAIDYAAHFGRSAPLWNSLPGQLGMSTSRPSGGDTAARKGQWQSPATLTTSSIAALQANLGRSCPPWCMSWQRLQGIDEAALPALSQLLQRWADDKSAQFVWSHAAALLALVQQHTVLEQRDTSAQWWLLRMAVLRFIHRMEEYEQVALDYCITYEVSPPAWQAPLHQCVVEENAEIDPTTVQESRWFADPQNAADTPAAPPIQGEGLWGVLEGDIEPHLARLSAKAQPGQVLTVDCSLLIRLDFVAAGGLLNWAAQLQGEGVELRFAHLHRLTAAFLAVIGVHEHAKLLLAAA